MQNKGRKIKAKKYTNKQSKIPYKEKNQAITGKQSCNTEKRAKEGKRDRKTNEKRKERNERTNERKKKTQSKTFKHRKQV